MAALPIPLVPRTASAAVSALNGQIWAIGAPDYRRLAPHAAHADEVLEDVMIGRFLKRSGLRLHFDDLQRDVAVRMYGSFGEAWRGFRKNAYLLAGGTPAPRGGLLRALRARVGRPERALGDGPLGLASLATLVGAKTVVDRSQGFPLWMTLAAPLALALGAGLQWTRPWRTPAGASRGKGGASG